MMTRLKKLKLYLTMNLHHIKIKKMKYNKLLLFALLVIISFLIIQISYNGMYSHSVFSSLYSILLQSIEKGCDFSTHDFTNNFIYNFIEVIALSLFLLISSILKKVKLSLIGVLLFIMLWLFWAVSYNGIIEIKLYILTSVPFLIMCIVSLVLYIKKLKALSDVSDVI